MNARAVWTLPLEKMKMRRPHRVPLSLQALAIVRNLESVSGKGRYLFPSIRTILRPISENTLNAALRRLGYSIDEVIPHGFRSTASVRLNEMGRWNPTRLNASSRTKNLMTCAARTRMPQNFGPKESG